LLIIWVYIAVALVASHFKGTFRRHVQDTIGCFAIGTWVAATAVLGRMINTALPEWRGVALALGAAMLVVWLAYLVLVSRGFWEVITGPLDLRLRVTGRILLSTVSTQSVLLLGISLFPGQIPGWLSAGIIALGYAFYALGFVLICRRYLRQAGLRLTDDWDNTNCILHGAMSITGLAAVQSNVVPGVVIIGTWLWVLVMFLIVETIELARAAARLRAYGWRRGLLTYDVSQWARNFTFGMFYTFTLQMYSAGYRAFEPSWLGASQGVVISWGHYVVLLFLLIEVALYLSLNISLRVQRAGLARLPAN
jgi:hypothetical protein